MQKELNASSAALVGRKEELAELVEIFNTVVEGNCCLAVFIGGYTGVGKTRLVGHFLATLESQMMFCTGQYDQFSKTAGIYSGLVDALNDLCLSISPTEELRAKLTEALGDDIKVLCDLISKSCRLLGVEESFSNSCRLETFLDLNADDTKTSRLDQATGFTRLKIAFQAFLRVLASEQPIVIFLDDFHRADSATLALFEFVLSDATTENIMFIATFRDHEVDLDYPLHLGMTTLQGAITTMKIGGLPLDDVNSLISNILNGDKTKTMELAKVIHRKTEGNAYFTIQLLELLSRQGILHFNGLSYSWEWDIDQADSETDLADTVVAIVAKKIEELDNMTKEVLKIASCLGSRFDGNVVQEIYVAMNGSLPDDTHSIRFSFQTAVKKGLINACSRTEPIYRWGHDRCQHTAYVPPPQIGFDAPMRSWPPRMAGPALLVPPAGTRMLIEVTLLSMRSTTTLRSNGSPSKVAPVIDTGVATIARAGLPAELSPATPSRMYPNPTSPASRALALEEMSPSGFLV